VIGRRATLYFAVQPDTTVVRLPPGEPRPISKKCGTVAVDLLDPMDVQSKLRPPYSLAFRETEPVSSFRAARGTGDSHLRILGMSWVWWPILE
jgi:hypothetical protein